MRVGVDARSVTGPRGVTRYTIELLRALVGGFPDDRFVVFVPGRGELPAIADVCAAPNVAVRRYPLPSRLLFGSAAIVRRPHLERLLGETVDVVWVPAPAPVALSGRAPYVLTLHDVTWEANPRFFTPYERIWHKLARPRALADRARSLIVPGEVVRDELVAHWAVDPARIHVVPEGVRTGSAGDADVRARLSQLGVRPGGFLLVSGALEPRKAPEVIARAFARARQQGLDSELVFAGDGRLAAQLRQPGVRLLGWRDGATLDALYRGALALVFGSRLEGFGLPVYEALARGTPAIISDLPVFGDELSPGVLRVAVDDELGLSEAMLRLGSDTALRARLAAAAPTAVAGLTWEAAASTTRAVLAEAAGLGRDRHA